MFIYCELFSESNSCNEWGSTAQKFESEELPGGWWRLCWGETKAIDVKYRVFIPSCRTHKNPLAPQRCLCPRTTCFGSSDIFLNFIVWSWTELGLPSAKTKQDSVYKPLWNWWKKCSGKHFFKWKHLVANSKDSQRILLWTNPAVLFRLDLQGKIYPLKRKKNPSHYTKNDGKK